MIVKILFLFLLMLPGGNPEMVKEYTLVDSGVDIVQTNYSNKNWYFDGTYNWIADTYGNGTYGIKLYRYSADWTVKTVINNGDGGVQYVDVCRYVDPRNTNNFGFYFLAPIDIYGNQQVHTYYTNNGGSTWSSGSYVETGTTEIIGFDVEVSYSLLAYYTYVDDTCSDPLGQKMSRVMVKKGAISSQDVGYYAIYDGTNILIRSHTPYGSVFATIETITTFTSLDTFDHTAIYWQNANATQKIVAWPERCYIYSNGAWKEVTSVAGTNHIPCWDFSDGEYVAGLVFGNRYLDISSGYIKQFVMNATIPGGIGYKKVFVDSSTGSVFSLELATSERFISYVPDPKIEEATIAKFQTLEKLYENEYIALYSNAGVLIHDGEVKNVSRNNQTQIYSGIVRSLLYNDLKQPISYTGTCTIAELFDTIKSTYFAYGTSGTLTSSATDRFWNFQDQEAGQVLKEAAHMEGLNWYPNIAMQIQLNDGTTNSTKSFKTSDGKYPETFNLDDNVQKVGRVIGIGANGAYYDYKKDASNGLFVLYLPSQEQAELEVSVIKFAQLENQTQNIVTITKIFDLLPLQPGTQLDFEYIVDDDNLSGMWYIKEVEFDALDNYIYRLVLHNVMFFKKENLTAIQVLGYTKNVEDIANAALPNSMATSKVLGRMTAGTGAVEELTLEDTPSNNSNRIASSKAVYNVKQTADAAQTTADAALPNSMATAKILGRTTEGTGAVEQLDLEQTATNAAAKIPSSAAVYKKANLESPTFTGTPSLPTGTTGVTQATQDNSTKLATTAYVSGSYVLLTNSGNHTLNNATWTLITWDTEIRDIGSMHSTSSNTHRIVITTGGNYEINFHIVFPSRSGAWYYSIRLNDTGSTSTGTEIDAGGIDVTAGWNYHIDVKWSRNFNQNDTIAIEIYNATGGNSATVGTYCRASAKMVQ